MNYQNNENQNQPANYYKDNNLNAPPVDVKKLLKPWYKKPWVWVIFAVVILAAVGGITNQNKTDSESKTTSSAVAPAADSKKSDDKKSGETSAVAKTEPETNDNNVYKVGDVLDADGVKITMDSAEEWTSDNEFIEPEKGNKFIRVFFTIKNERGKDQFISCVDFDCYADDVACDMSFYGDNQLSTKTLSSGKTMKGYIYYEVPKDSKKIIIEYETNWWTDEKATFEVEL